ncbi:transcription elongation factor GreAB [Enterococcus plantarum]|uniref:relaxase/mobilization nuclease domain-containing protein n=1 Tax=Enterococcus plantarum TaxID=1077675 RepID=UPI00084E0052|nr:relaxase/mobilization nuclease domain-containing protein [Enterococcus plantarum]OEG18040.1 transcription elongation factor GreAB [Enterococcus plantarum]
MVYTKHFVIHTFDKLNNACGYIENAEKTIVTNEDTQDHLAHLFQYIANDEKTNMKQLVSGHGIIDPTNAYEEFKFTKLRTAFQQKKGYTLDLKKNKLVPPSLTELERKNAVLAHHLIQSFSPDDNLSPEKIHEIGYNTVMELTGGDYEFVIATHVDKEHIHNHILFNSTNLKTGKAFRWQKGTKRVYEQISDKIAAKEGAKIIQKSPKNTHKKYTMWQTESMFKQKIKSRLDFLLAHSSSIEDFLQKADALNLSVDFSKKWATYKLLDEAQIKNTRSRSLSKNNPDRYNYEAIGERLKENTTSFSIDEVVSRYEEKVMKQENDFDYQLTIDAWQISHKTDKGYYLNVDFGFENRGKLFIGAYKVDPIEEDQFNIYVKRNDFFYFMNEKNSERNRYMTGETLIKQLRLYNGTTPLKKEPIMRTIDQLVDAINFLAEHKIEGKRQLTMLEEKLIATFSEAEETLDHLDEKIIQLNNLGKLLLEKETQGGTEEIQKQLHEILTDATLSEFTFEDVQGEIESITLSQSLLESKLENTRNEIDKLHEIQAIQSQKEEQEKNMEPKI